MNIRIGAVVLFFGGIILIISAVNDISPTEFMRQTLSGKVPRLTGAAKVPSTGTPGGGAPADPQTPSHQAPSTPGPNNANGVQWTSV